MALLDFLKRKKEAEKAKKPVKKTEEVKIEKKIEKPAVAKSSGVAKKAHGFNYNIVKQPHISEKATYLSEKDQYVFIVAPNSNKEEIKKSVEGLYNVDVLSVNIIKIPAKKRRLGKTEGFKKGFKKAIVKIKSGQKIEIL